MSAEVTAVLKAVDEVAEGAPQATRLGLARRLDRLDDELRGRAGLEPVFYAEGRLGVVRLYEPVRVQGAVDTKRIDRHLRRYEERLDRAERRLVWLLKRAGLEPGVAPKLKPWELPYATFEEVHELVWRRRRRN